MKAILVIFIVISTVIALKISSKPSIYSHAPQKASASTESLGKSVHFVLVSNIDKQLKEGPFEGKFDNLFCFLSNLGTITTLMTIKSTKTA